MRAIIPQLADRSPRPERPTARTISPTRWFQSSDGVTAFKVAESEKPGSTHLELPEDVMMRPLDGIIGIQLDPAEMVDDLVDRFAAFPEMASFDQSAGMEDDLSCL